MDERIKRRLQVIKHNEQLATCGPWERDVTEEGVLIVDLRKGGGETGYMDVIPMGDMEINDGQDFNNADFIASARTDVPYLVEALETALEALDVYANSGDRGFQAIAALRRIADSSSEGVEDEQ